VLTIVLALLADHGVDDVELIIATGIHRRMKPAEIRHIVGDKIFDAYHPERLYNHDAKTRRTWWRSAALRHGDVLD